MQVLSVLAAHNGLYRFAQARFQIFVGLRYGPIPTHLVLWPSQVACCLYY